MRLSPVPRPRFRGVPALPVLAWLLLASCPPGTGLPVARGMVAGDPPLGYTQVGRLGGLTVVVLHGGPGVTHDYLRPEWDGLAGVGRVIYYDQRGCGRSGRAESYHWRDHLADLDRVLDVLAPGERVVLAGSSWGTHLALLYALHHPRRTRALVLSGAPPWEYIERGRRSWPGMSPEDRAHMDSLARGLAAGDRRAPDARCAAMRGTNRLALGNDRAFRARFRLYSPEAWAATNASMSTAPLLPSLRQIGVPALVVRGTRAPAHQPDGSEEIVRTLPNARLLTIRGAGHDPWYSHPGRFFGRARAFVAGLEEPSGNAPGGTRPPARP